MASTLELQAKEALLVDLYRQGGLSHHDLGVALGIDRFEVEALLKRHGVVEDLQTVEEQALELERAREMMRRGGA